MSNDSAALLETPDAPWASDAIELVFTQESRSVANHSARSWIFARMLRDHLNLTQEVDETLLFAATLLHDIGLRRDARDPVRFEIDGADRAAEFLTAQGLDAAQVDKVWEAIALHTSPGIPERRGPLTFLTRAGAGMDFGKFTECISDDQAAASTRRTRGWHSRAASSTTSSSRSGPPLSADRCSLSDTPLSANARHRHTSRNWSARPPHHAGANNDGMQRQSYQLSTTGT